MTADEIKKAVKEAMDEHRSAFYIDEETHYNDHQHLKMCRTDKPEWKANHKFVSHVRENKDIVSLLESANNEWADNHTFISDVRQTGTIAKSVAIKLFVTFVIGVVFAALVRGFAFK